MKKANNMEVKKINRNRVYRFVNRQERVSRPDIAAALGISGPTVLQIVNELLSEGLIEEVGEFQSTGGRKAKAVAPVHNACYAVGLDITKNHVSLVLSDLSGQILKHIRIHRTFEPTKKYYEQNGQTLYDFIEEAQIPADKILGVGISMPGIVDRANNILTDSHILGVSNIACREMERYIPYPCMMVNDANAAGITEQNTGKQGSTVVYLSLSNSVGGAIITRDNAWNTGEIGSSRSFQDYIYTGEHWRSAEFGHMTIVPDGKECYCGQKGCLDSYCSALIFANLTNGKLEEFFKRVEQGDVEFNRTLDTYLDYLAIAVNNLRMAFDCDIVLGGYVGSYMDEHIQKLREKVAKRDTFGGTADYVKACRYKIEASALGAALLYIETYIDSI